jgi:protein TonB
MKLLRILILLLTPWVAHAQKIIDSGTVLYTIKGNDTTIIEKPPFAGKYVDKMPEAIFNGNLKTYITRHAIYPDSLKKKNIKGVVELYFEVDTAGYIGEAVVISNTHPLLDDIALKLLRNMPPWKPAMLEGRPIYSRSVIYVPFR